MIRPPCVPPPKSRLPADPEAQAEVRELAERLYIEMYAAENMCCTADGAINDAIGFHDAWRRRTSSARQ